jgi:hypothetical protein
MKLKLKKKTEEKTNEKEKQSRRLSRYGGGGGGGGGGGKEAVDPGSDFLDWSEYRSVCTQYEATIRSLNFNSTFVHQHQSMRGQMLGPEGKRKKKEDGCSGGGGGGGGEEGGGGKGKRPDGSNAFFGEKKWAFMLSVMLGLQLVVEGSACKYRVHRRASKSTQSAAAAAMSETANRFSAANDVATAEMLRAAEAAALQATGRSSMTGSMRGGGLPQTDKSFSPQLELDDEEKMKFRLPSSSAFCADAFGQFQQQQQQQQQDSRQQKAGAPAPAPAPAPVGGKRGSVLRGPGVLGGEGDLYLTAYWPRVFAEVRRACGVDDQAFLAALGIRQVVGSLLLGDITGLSEKVSEGR